MANCSAARVRREGSPHLLEKYRPPPAHYLLPHFPSPLASVLYLKYDGIHL